MQVSSSSSGVSPEPNRPQASDLSLKDFDSAARFQVTTPSTGEGGQPHAVTPLTPNGTSAAHGHVNGGDGPTIIKLKEDLDKAYAPSSGASNQTVADPKSKFKFPFVRHDQIKLNLDNQYLIKGLLPAQGLAVVYGAPSSGKSFLTLHAMLHVATGLEYAGRRVRKGRVLYIAAEGQGAFRNRVWAAKQALGVQAEDFILIEVAPNLGARAGDTNTLIKEIRAQLRQGEAPPDVIAIDTLSQTMFGEDENQEGMATFITNSGTIRQELGGLIFPVHHVGKDEGRGMRGWSGLHGACDCEWETLNKDGERSVHLEKYKDGLDGTTWRFRLQQTELGKDKDGDPVTTCTVEIIGEPAEAGARATVSIVQAIADEHLFLHLLDMLTLQGRHVSPNPSVTYAPSVFAKLPEGKDVTKKRFEDAMNKLLSANRIKVDEVGPLSKRRSILVRFL